MEVVIHHRQFESHIYGMRVLQEVFQVSEKVGKYWSNTMDKLKCIFARNDVSQPQYLFHYGSHVYLVLVINVS